MSVTVFTKAVLFEDDPTFVEYHRDPVQPPMDSRAFTFCHDS